MAGGASGTGPLDIEALSSWLLSGDKNGSLQSICLVLEVSGATRCTVETCLS